MTLVCVNMVLSLTHGREECKIIKSYGNDDDDTGTNRIHRKIT